MAHHGAPDTKPAKPARNAPTYEVAVPRYEACQELPLRTILLGLSGFGKTVLLASMILDLYKDCFERVFIFSPSVFVDDVWAPVRKYLLKRRSQESGYGTGEESEAPAKKGQEKLFFDSYDPADLQAIVERQAAIVKHQKKGAKAKAALKQEQQLPIRLPTRQDDNVEHWKPHEEEELPKKQRLMSILIIIDDFADDPRFVRQSKLLHALFVRGRHYQISTVVATQKYTALSPIIRVNAIELFVFRLRSFQDLATFLEEQGALLDKDTLRQLYETAVNDRPYSFLRVRLNAKSLDDMFSVRFDRRISFGDHS